MIWESGPWKTRLYRTVLRCEDEFQRISRAPALSWWDQACWAQRAEEAAFGTAFIVRKLLDSNRLSVQIADRPIKVTTFGIRNQKQVPDSLNWDRLDQFYEMDKPSEADFPVRDVVNWLIHSYIFVAESRSDLAGGQIIDGFVFSSDRTRSRQLYHVTWEEYRSMLMAVVNDHIVEIVLIRDGLGREVSLLSSIPLSSSERSDFRRTHQKLIDELIATQIERQTL